MNQIYITLYIILFSIKFMYQNLIAAITVYKNWLYKSIWVYQYKDYWFLFICLIGFNFLIISVYDFVDKHILHYIGKIIIILSSFLLLSLLYY